MTSRDPLDLLIIGAGISGIVAARFYLDIHPECNLALLERDACIGGTWGWDRLYPGFKAQASTRMCSFSDIPLSVPPGGADDLDCPDSRHIAEYLDIYVDKHLYNGRSIRDRIHLDTSVTELKKVSELWRAKASQKGSIVEFMAKKVIVASGNTSVPNMPNLPGKDQFGGLIVHSMDYGRSWKTLSDSKFDKFAVLGGGKSAADMVYQLAKAGKQVTWIIRKSGKGVGTLIYGKGVGQFKNLGELARTRAFSRLFLSGLRSKTWLDWVLWDTWAGQVFRNWFDGMAMEVSVKQARWDDRKNAREGFQLLKSQSKPNFLAGPAGMVQWDDFWDTIATQVDVCRKDIDRLESHKIFFTDGSELEADALMCGTGFKMPYPFFTEAELVRLGLPHNPNLESPTEREEWNRLEKEAEGQVIQQYPILAQPYPNLPEHFGDIDTRLTPFRLHQVIGPITDQSIAFVGVGTLSNMFEAVEVEAIWATGFLDGTVKLPDVETMKREVAFRNAYMRLRVPTYGHPGHFFLFDAFPYIEGLLERDLGLKSWHHKTLLEEWTSPYLPCDLKGVKDEYLEKYGKTA